MVKLTPTFIRAGYCLIFDGCEHTVQEFRPVHNDLPYPSGADIRNCTLEIKINDKWHKYDQERMKPLPVPAHLKPRGLTLEKGEKVSVTAAGFDYYPEIIQNAYLLKKTGSRESIPVVDGEVLINIHCDRNSKKLVPRL